LRRRKTVYVYHLAAGIYNKIPGFSQGAPLANRIID